MRTPLLSLGILIVIGALSSSVAADREPSAAAKSAETADSSIRLAQNRRRNRPNRRDSIVEGCGVRDALCVANRLLRQIQRQTGGDRRRQIDELGKLMQRTCGAQPKDVVCAGDFVARAYTIASGPARRPAPIIRERGRERASQQSVSGIACVYRGGRYWHVRLSDNKPFGERGWESEFGYGSCNWSLRNMNQRHAIICIDHTYDNILRYTPQSMRDAYGYGWGMPNGRSCVDAVNGIRRGGICIFQRRVGYRIMDIRSRIARGRVFPSIGQCLSVLNQ